MLYLECCQFLFFRTGQLWEVVWVLRTEVVSFLGAPLRAETHAVKSPKGSSSDRKNAIVPRTAGQEPTQQAAEEMAVQYLPDSNTLETDGVIPSLPKVDDVLEPEQIR